MTAVGSIVSKTFLGNVKVRTKILGGSGIILATLVIVGGLSFLAFTNVAHDFEEYSSAAALGNSAEDGGRLRVLAGRRQRIPVDRGSGGSEQDRRLIKEMTGIVEQAKGLARTEEETKEITEVGEKIAAFHKEFQRVGELTRSNRPWSTR